MICIIFVAGHNDRLEREIAEDKSGAYDHLKGVPKALLPVSMAVPSLTTLGRWWASVNTRQQFREVYLVTNASKYKHFERWATANDFPVENIINDGTTTSEMRLGSVADLDLVLRVKGIRDSDIMVVAGDMLFEHGFDISGVQRFFVEKKGDVTVYYDLAPHERTDSRGIIDVDPSTLRVSAFYEKPKEGSGVTSSRAASVVFYVFRAASLILLPQYLQAHHALDELVFGRFIQWLLTRGGELYGMKLPTAFDFIGQTRLLPFQSVNVTVLFSAVPQLCTGRRPSPSTLRASNASRSRSGSRAPSPSPSRAGPTRASA